MRKLIYCLFAAVLLMSCEIQESNGPKVSQDTLEVELKRLVFITVNEALSIVEELEFIYDPTSEFQDTLVKHVAENTWECRIWYYSIWDQLYHVSENPFVCKKLDEEWWSVTYQGNGLEIGEKNNLSFTTTIHRIGEYWDVSVNGVVLDGDYRMDFSTDRIRISTDKINSSLKSGELIYSGSFQIATQRDGAYLHGLKVIQNDFIKCYEDEMFKDRTTWTYSSLVKPEWVE